MIVEKKKLKWQKLELVPLGNRAKGLEVDCAACKPGHSHYEEPKK